MSDGTQRAHRPELDAAPSPRLTRTISDGLLDGNDGPAALRHLLDAATQPGSPTELYGEVAARAAFVASAHRHLPTSDCVPTATTRARTWRRIVIGKTIAVIALAAGAGGVAVAATAIARPAEPPSATTTQTSPPPTIPPYRVADTDPTPGVGPDPSAQPRPANDPAETKSDTPVGQCQDMSANDSNHNGGVIANSDLKKSCATSAPEDPLPHLATTPDEHGNVNAPLPEPGPTAVAPPGSSTRSDSKSGHSSKPQHKPDHPTKPAVSTDKSSKKPKPEHPADPSEAAPGQAKKNADSNKDDASK